MAEMASTIKLFQYLQTRYQWIGIYPSQQNQTSGSFNLKNSIFIVVFVQMLLASVAFFIFKAEKPFDYGFSFIGIISELAMSVYYPIIIFKMSDILALIEKYEEFIERSK